MTAPRLNRPLVLEAPVRQPDGAGGYGQTWQALGTLWAQVAARTGREVADVTAPVSRVAYRITVRAAPVGAPSRPRPEQRFRDGQRILSILAVAEADTEGRWLICDAEEEIAP
ncbi:MAG: head-tail adaptor protein [Limimaricola sp.]|uniref:head-tail adaptor protein n=1 Tax=Limimaricola sp. TaxID=2211665 RepID=UPI001D699B76|nr:head-tail adaptor protein [Limimaricola sp.]MBI1416683.1 head-tail adaptor protein [Limimaricola sp.]